MHMFLCQELQFGTNAVSVSAAVRIVLLQTALIVTVLVENILWPLLMVRSCVLFRVGDRSLCGFF